jgi:prepilin-type N-terminal cleavage/methylation domain-containing protein
VIHGTLLSFLAKMRKRLSDKKGFTLIELMVGLGLSGVVFLIMMTLMGQTAKFAAFFNGTATSIEGVSDAQAWFNPILNGGASNAGSAHSLGFIPVLSPNRIDSRN